VFGSITDEQLDLMTLEQVRMWILAKRQTAGSTVGVKANLEIAQRRSPSDFETDEDAENEDYSWMDDMEAVAPV
jgi:hypothetical protein